MEYKAVILSVVIFVHAMRFGEISGCSNPNVRGAGHSVTVAQKVHYSDYVVVGVVGKPVSDDRYPYSDVGGIQTFEVDVTCIYKEESNNTISGRTIYVTGVGNENGEIPGCPPAQLAEAQIVALFLRKLHGNVANLFEIEFSPNTAFDYEYVVDDITVNCGLSLIKSYNLNLCFEPYEDEYCIKHEPLDLPPPTTPVTDTEPTPEENPEKEIILEGDIPKSNPTPSGGASTHISSGSLIVLVDMLIIMMFF